MEEDFKFSKDFASMFNDALKIKNIDRMQQIFNELCSEVGHSNPGLDLSSAAAGERVANYLNARENNTSFEGSVPGKKV